MIKIIVDIFKIPELRRRVLATLGLLLLFRIGFFIYLPGIDVAAHRQALETQGGGALDWLFYTSRLTGGRLSSPVLFSLGIMPYISASIIFSLLVKVFPRLEALSKEGEQGRRVIARYTRYATLALCVVQSFFLIFPWQEGASGMRPVSAGGVWITTLQCLCLTGGSLFVMWLGEKITEYGIGNGSSLIIMAGILGDVPGALGQLIGLVIRAESDELPFRVTNVLLILALFCAVVAAVVFITKGQRRIPVQQQRAVKGRRVYGGQRQYMPIKVNSAGVLPIIFASSLIMIPTLFLQSIAFGDTWIHRFFLRPVASALQWGGFLHVFVYCALIVFFTYFWTSLMFNPVEIAGNMKEYGSFIPGIRPGKRTAEYLDRILKRITLAGAAFLCLIALVPNFVSGFIPGVEYTVTQFLGGTGILIIVGVALDLVEKIEAQLLVRQYEGFMRGGEGPRRSGSRPGGSAGKSSVPSV